jgi:hypothetical protein
LKETLYKKLKLLFFTASPELEARSNYGKSRDIQNLSQKQEKFESDFADTLTRLATVNQLAVDLKNQLEGKQKVGTYCMHCF